MASTREVGAAAGAAGEPVAGEVVAGHVDATPVVIGVVHASLDHASYALMIGTFAGEQFGGVERFIDSQFGGLLSSWVELDRYPTALGTSRFIAPARPGEPD